jgi:hypothetical protein
MKWFTLKGRATNIPTAKYRVDWDGKQGSQFAAEVLAWLRPYWKGHEMLAEFPVAGTKSRFDYVNLTRHIIVEADGVQHNEFNPHFHRDSRAVYGAQIERDFEKDDIARLNGFTMVRIKPSDLPLTKAWLEKTFDITL